MFSLEKITLPFRDLWQQSVAIENYLIVWNWLLIGVLALFHYFQPFSLWLTICVWVVWFLSAWLSPAAAVTGILLGIIFFERWFTLAPLVIGGSVIKIYSVDIAWFFVVISLILPPLLQLRFHAWWLNLKSAWLGRSPEAKKIDLLVFAWIALISIIALGQLLFGSDLSTIFSSWKNYAGYGFIYFIIIYLWNLHPDGEEQVKRTAAWLIFSALPLLIFPILGVILGQGVWSEFTPLSTSGTRFLASTHSFFFGFILLGILAFKGEILIGHKFFTQLFSSRLWLGILLSVLILGLYRNIWLALAAMLIVLFTLLIKAKRLKFKNNFLPLLVGVFSFGLLLQTASWYYGERTKDIIWQFPILTSVQTRVESLFTTSTGQLDDSASWRLAAWQGSLSQFWGGNVTTRIKNFLVGDGLGVQIYFSFSNFNQNIVATALHNDWLAFLVQAGLPALSLMVYLLYTVARKVSYDWQRQPQALWLWPALALGYFCVAAFFGTYFSVNIFVIWFWVWLAWLNSKPNTKSHPESVQL